MSTLSKEAEDAKKRFERERDKVLSELPVSIKSHFGEIGFSYSETANDWVPVLVINPYHVPPKPIRDVYWYDMFSKGKRAKKLGQIQFLVYWYGSEDPNDCYSFIEQGAFEDYAFGETEGHTKIPDRIQEKMDKCEPLTEAEEEKVRATKEMLEDVDLAPEDRKRGAMINGFKEMWELMDDEDDEEEEEEAEEDSKKRKRK